MKTYSDVEPQVFDVSGSELRIHWGIQQVEIPGADGETKIVWECNEALCNTYDDRSLLIEKIIGAVYSPSAEIATINNQQDKPESYAEYQAFRLRAKALADGWLAQRQEAV